MYSINKQELAKSANIKQNRFLEIAKIGENIFHTDDLAKIWKIENKNTLNMTLKRYVDSGLLYRVYRGLYSLSEPISFDPLLLGARAINNYCYLSGETVLAQQGIIFQKINYFTFVGTQSKRWKIFNYQYYCRQLKDDFLYNDLGVDKTGKFNIATTERAVADILYFNPDYHFDNQTEINWKKVKEIQKKVYNNKNL